VNTLRYRIRRIEELTGRDLSSLDHRVDFVLALDAGPAGIRPGPAGEG
jgi:DNA-binding PucR family transcriptional regulator